MNAAESPFPEPFEIEITDSIDLHSFSPKDVKKVIVRIIHGKGIGVQREMVRSVLAGSDVVESYKNAPEFSGSWGSTIVKLKAN